MFQNRKGKVLKGVCIMVQEACKDGALKVKTRGTTTTKKNHTFVARHYDEGYMGISGLFSN
jgi:hypothetical protein